MKQSWIIGGFFILLIIAASVGWTYLGQVRDLPAIGGWLEVGKLPLIGILLAGAVVVGIWYFNLQSKKSQK